MGLLKSHIVKTFSFAETVESINEKHMQPWSEMCKVFLLYIFISVLIS